MAFTFKLRRGTAAEWTIDNPTLAAGEPGLETDTGKLKIGDGGAAWSVLPYYLTEPLVEALITAMLEDAVLEGVEGDSAYDVAVANGFVGTEEEWLDSLVGAQGPAGTNGTNGTNGSSAYQVAVANGFVGNEAAWLASLVGADGADGAQGPPGEDGADGAQGPPGEDGEDGVVNYADPTFTGTVTFSGRQITTEDALSIVSNAVAVNASLGNRFTLAATGNFTLSNPSNGVAGQQITIRITQDATGGRVLTLGSNYKLGVDIESVILSTAANATDYLGLICRNGTVWDVVSFVRGFPA